MSLSLSMYIVKQICEICDKNISEENYGKLNNYFLK